MLIHDIFEKDVARDINPVVYFHEQDPKKLAEEVSEYIITGGYPEGDPRSNKHGIHEQFVRLLNGIAAELGKQGGTDEPAAWISGYYGSGKSSFAKLLGLSLNGTKLPDGTALAGALLKRDEAPNRAEFIQAWEAILAKVKPMAVVFDIGSVARDDEHIHSAIVRQCQAAMGYCPISQVADHEIKLEADGLYEQFLDKVKEVHKKAWSEIREKKVADDYFSAVLHALEPEIYRDEMAWVDAKAGSKASRSAEEAVSAIEHMLKHRFAARTLFLVVDEVSQYVHDNADRMLKLQSLVMALGQRLKGKVWLLATGQQRLEDSNSPTAQNLQTMKDRFPPQLRVHLGSNNIRDVVHHRLLKKKPTVRAHLEELFRENRPNLSLYGYKCTDADIADLVDVYPMLPGHIDLLMEITTGLRDRSSRVQGDTHAIRGLLQMLGDLFRESNLGQHEVGALITLDRIYDVLHSALDADVQTTLTRAFHFVSKHGEWSDDDKKLAERVIKAVSLVELITDERVKRDAEYIARTLYARLGDGSQREAIQHKLDLLRGNGFVDFSEKTGYKIQSSAGQEWQKERDKHSAGVEQISQEVQKTLTWAMGEMERPLRDGMAIPWQAWFSAAIGAGDVQVKAERSATKIEVDFRYLSGPDAEKAQWVAKSDQATFRNRIVWVAGEVEGPREAATQLIRSLRMIERYGGSEASLTAEKRRFLTEERNREDDARTALKEAVESAFLAGTLYFRGKDYEAKECGSSLGSALKDVGDRAVKQLYPNPVTYRVTESELKFLIESKDLAAPPPVFLDDRLGVLSQDGGRFEASCVGTVPTEIAAVINEQPGISGSSLLAVFGGPPHGYSSDIIRAALIGLMRGHRLRVCIPGVGELTSAREAGARELFKDITLRKSEFFANKEESITGRDRNAICKMFLDRFGSEVSREPDDIADAVAQYFPSAREQLSEVQLLLSRLPDKPQPKALEQLEKALESCRRDRKVEPTLKALKRNLAQLGDGLSELRRLRTDLTEEAVRRVGAARDFEIIYLPQLQADATTGKVDSDAVQIGADQLRQGLGSPRPWEMIPLLNEQVDKLKALYVKRRGEVLAHQQLQIEGAIQSLKLHDGFDTLSQDQQHQVLHHLREGAPFHTKADVPVPALSDLETLFPVRLQTALGKALAQLDELRESQGEKPTVTVALRLEGQEVDSEAALDRLLGELRTEVVAELKAGRRVRLK